MELVLGGGELVRGQRLFKLLLLVGRVDGRGLEGLECMALAAKIDRVLEHEVGRHAHVFDRQHVKRQPEVMLVIRHILFF